MSGLRGNSNGFPANVRGTMGKMEEGECSVGLERTVNEYTRVCMCVCVGGVKIAGAFPQKVHWKIFNSKLSQDIMEWRLMRNIKIKSFNTVCWLWTKNKLASHSQRNRWTLSIRIVGSGAPSSTYYEQADKINTGSLLKPPIGRMAWLVENFISRCWHGKC